MDLSYVFSLFTITWKTLFTLGTWKYIPIVGTFAFIANTLYYFISYIYVHTFGLFLCDSSNVISAALLSTTYAKHILSCRPLVLFYVILQILFSQHLYPQYMQNMSWSALRGRLMTLHLHCTWVWIENTLVLFSCNFLKVDWNIFFIWLYIFIFVWISNHILCKTCLWANLAEWTTTLHLHCCLHMISYNWFSSALLTTSYAKDACGHSCSHFIWIFKLLILGIAIHTKCKTHPGLPARTRNLYYTQIWTREHFCFDFIRLFKLSILSIPSHTKCKTHPGLPARTRNLHCTQIWTREHFCFDFISLSKLSILCIPSSTKCKTNPGLPARTRNLHCTQI